MGGAALVAEGGGAATVVRMLIVEAVGIGGGGRVEGLVGSGKFEINRRHWDEHR